MAGAEESIGQRVDENFVADYRSEYIGDLSFLHSTHDASKRLLTIRPLFSPSVRS